MDTSSEGTRQAPPLPLFALIEAPYGMQTGVMLVVAMYMLRRAGVGIAEAGAISGLCALPSTFYFLYAPLADFFFRRKTWLLFAVVATSLLSGVAIAMSGAHHLRLLIAVMVAGSITDMLISAATGGLMGSLLNHAEQGRVGAWVQVGNLGGSSAIFGVLLYLESRLSVSVLAVATTLVMLAPGMAALALREPPVERRAETYGATLLGIGKELKSTLLSMRSLPGILLMIAPIGSGAITTVLSGLSREYGATTEQLGFANGWGGGMLTALGALVVLLMPKHWNRMLPYAVAGTIYGAVSLGIGAGPMRASTLVVGLLASNFAQGIAFATYTGLVLQTMGMGGRCQSSRYTILNSIGSMPVAYMPVVEGWVAGRYGPRAVGLWDGVLNLAVVVVFLGWWVWVRARHAAFVAVVEA